MLLHFIRVVEVFQFRKECNLIFMYCVKCLSFLRLTPDNCVTSFTLGFTRELTDMTCHIQDLHSLKARLGRVF